MLKVKTGKNRKPQYFEHQTREEKQSVIGEEICNLKLRYAIRKISILQTWCESYDRQSVNNAKVKHRNFEQCQYFSIIHTSFDCLYAH